MEEERRRMDEDKRMIEEEKRRLEEEARLRVRQCSCRRSSTLFFYPLM